MSSSSTSEVPILMLWPSVPAWRLNGKLLLDRKFKDGIDLWCRYWPGRVVTAMSVATISEAPAFGAYEWGSGEAPFDLLTLSPGQPLTASELRGVQVLLASGDDYRQLPVAEMCEKLGIVCIFTIEYTLRTRLAINRYSGRSALKKLKSALWLLRNEIRLTKAMKQSAGIQANGLPALRSYAGLVKSAMHYFDTRLSSRDIVSSGDLELRLKDLHSGAPLASRILWTFD